MLDEPALITSTYLFMGREGYSHQLLARHLDIEVSGVISDHEIRQSKITSESLLIKKECS